MFELDKDAESEHMVGVQEAAGYLGIHRATLFRALNNGLIIPDRRTPKGRARFRMETIEAFQTTLRSQAATSQDHVYAPVRVMAKLASVLRMPRPSADIASTVDEALHLLCTADGHFDKACVAILNPTAHDRYAATLLGQLSIPERLKSAYRCLRPYEEFPLTRVLHTGDAEICEDISGHSFPNATAMRVLKQNGVISYAVLPMIMGDDAANGTFGVLIVCGQKPHKFSRQELIFLGGVADALSACIMRDAPPMYLANTASTVLRPEKAVDVASALLDAAFSQARCPKACSSFALPVEPLCDVLVEKSHALAIWVDGFPPQACGDTADPSQEDEVHRQYRHHLRSFVHHTSTADSLKREQWQSQVTAVALPVRLPSGQRGAVGAVWPGVREEVSAEGMLLSTLANACSFVTEYSAGGGN